MSRHIRSGVFLPILLALTLSSAADVYKDPKGRFTVAIPSGWTTQTADNAVNFQHGDSFATVLVFPGSAGDSQFLAKFERRLASGEWKNLASQQTGSETLSGIRGTSAIYTGTNSKGADALLKLVTADSGADAYLLVMASPASEFAAVKSTFDQIELSLAIHASASTADPASLAKLWGAPGQPAAVPPAPAVEKPLPRGFHLVGPANQTAQAFYGPFNSAPSAVRAFSDLFSIAGQYFDQQPRLSAAWTDPSGEQVQALFAAVFRGVPVTGLATVTVQQGGSGFIAVLFDRSASFSRSLPTLSRGVSAALQAEVANLPAPARPAPQLIPTNIPGNQGTISLPPGWQIAGANNGVVDLKGPNGEGGSLGAAIMVTVPGALPGQAIANYTGPAGALSILQEFLIPGSISRRQVNLKVLDQAPTAFPNGEGSYFVVEATAPGAHVKALDFIGTARQDSQRWMLYFSYLSAPYDRFDQDIPAMWEMWKSWSINPGILRDRMNEAARTMRSISGIIDAAQATRDRANDNVSIARSQLMRGLTTVENSLTGERLQLDNTSADAVLRELNRKGGQFREVQLPDLSRP